MLDPDDVELRKFVLELALRTFTKDADGLPAGGYQNNLDAAEKYLEFLKSGSKPL